MNRTLLPSLIIVLFTLAGCGSQQRKQKDYFTSGNREADQRADQRMAKDNQLRGSGSGGNSPVKSDVKKSLYERLGSEDGMKQIVNDFVDRALADPRVNWERKGITQGGISLRRGKSEEWPATAMNVKLLKLHLAQFLALATGGPTTYQGKEMKSAHESMHITNAEFDASVGDFKATLDKLAIPVQEQKEVLSIIESTRPQVVEEQ